MLRSPPMTPVSGDTSLATIQSQPLDLRFFLACSSTCSVSAAKPIINGGRLPGFRCAIVFRISAFSTRSSLGVACFSVFFIFSSALRATRQSATAAANTPTSAGSAPLNRCQHLSRTRHPHHINTERIAQRHWARHQRHTCAKVSSRFGDSKALLTRRSIGDIANRIDRLMRRTRRDQHMPSAKWSPVERVIAARRCSISKQRFHRSQNLQRLCHPTDARFATLSHFARIGSNKVDAVGTQQSGNYVGSRRATTCTGSSLAPPEPAYRSPATRPLRGRRHARPPSSPSSPLSSAPQQSNPLPATIGYDQFRARH